MFTMALIDKLHDRLGTAETLADYLRGLAAIGVVRDESFSFDGHTEVFAPDGNRVGSPSHHEVLKVAEASDRHSFLEHLRRHADKKTTYLEMSAGLAASGVDKWVADPAALTMTYYDRTGLRPNRPVLLVDKVE